MPDGPDHSTVDPTVLERLADELGDTGAAGRVCSIYLELLDERVRQLCDACAGDDIEAAIEKVLTLKVTSATVGATAVRRCAEAIEEWLRDGRLCQLARSLERLQHAAAETLTSGLGTAGGTGEAGVIRRKGERGDAGAIRRKGERGMPE
jgi:HPt (histidine-containing phosphotransfer) domain-containing protein